MTEHAHAPFLPLQSELARQPAVGLAVSPATCFDAIARAGAATSAYDAVIGLLEVLTALDGVRAGAVVRAAPVGGDLDVVGSVGYECGTFAPGASLPLRAGLPVTEAARTQRVVVQGSGPAWVAVPVLHGGALLLSLTCPPPAAEDQRRLARLGAALGPVLQRAHRADAAVHDFSVVTSQLAAPVTASADDVDITVVSRPYDGALGGDVVEVVAAPDGSTWLLVADVSGRGTAAAVAAVRLRAAFGALVPLSARPSDLLRSLQGALAGGDEDFATALALRLGGRVATVASAGHPAPFVIDASGVHEAVAPPGAPLGLSVDATPARDVEITLSAGSLLISHTDGLTDRDSEVDLAAVLRAVAVGPSGAVAADIISRCDQAGAAADDLTLVVLGL